MLSEMNFLNFLTGRIIHNCSIMVLVEYASSMLNPTNNRPKLKKCGKEQTGSIFHAYIN